MSSFYCFEGLAGSGKTTQSNLLREYLNDKGVKVFISTIYESDKRDLIDEFIDSLGINNDEISLMLLFESLHRNQYVETREKLDSNFAVIADRWRESFIIHHSHNQTFKNNIGLMKDLDTLTFEDLYPDKYIYLDIPASLAWNRYQERKKFLGSSALEIMPIEYFVEVEKMYSKLAKDNNWLIIDGSADEKIVHDNIIKELKI